MLFAMHSTRDERTKHTQYWKYWKNITRVSKSSWEIPFKNQWISFFLWCLALKITLVKLKFRLVLLFSVIPFSVVFNFLSCFFFLLSVRIFLLHCSTMFDVQIHLRTKPARSGKTHSNVLLNFMNRCHGVSVKASFVAKLNNLKE